MYKLIYKHHFDSAHKLKLDYQSPCQGLHGHRWEVVVEIEAPELDENGMIIDFSKIKELIDRLDHKNLNDILPFNPTAENIAKFLEGQISFLMGDLEKVRVTIFESPNASITYYE